MWNEITTVANEICEALGLSTKSASIAGRNAASCVTDATYWTIYDLQRLIYNNYTDFLPSDTDIEGEASAAQPANYSSWSTFCTNAGLSSSGFRRITSQTWPADWTDVDDAAYSYGYAQAGDVVGPWNWEDVRLAFDEMVKMKKAVSWDQDGTANNWKLGDSYPPYTSTWAAAKTALTADYGNDTYTDTAAPLHIYYGNRTAASPAEYRAQADGLQNQAKLTYTALDTLTTLVEFFVYAIKPSGGDVREWDANSDDVLEDQWHEWDSKSSPSSPVYSDHLGSMTEPTAPAEPALNNDRFRGWQVSDKVAIITFTWSYTT